MTGVVRAAVLTMLAACLAVISACDMGSDGEETSRAESTSDQSATGPAMPQIESSLEGLTVLPRRIQWTVTTSVPPEQIEAVRFFVDRGAVWTDPDPPFAYGEKGAQLGTWMGPGRHRFTVRVIRTDGSRFSKPVVAAVRAPKTDKERTLHGYWARLSEAQIETPTPPDKALDVTGPGMWGTERTLWVGRSVKHAFGYEYWIKGNVLYVGTAWFIGAPSEPGTIYGWRLHGSQCDAGQWPARYALTYKQGRRTGTFQGQGTYASYLVLMAKKDPCVERRQMLEGIWEALGG